MNAPNVGLNSKINLKFNYRWLLQNLHLNRYHQSKVFSTFSGGGGSSMGYKLAGYNVIGCCEIDPKMMIIYKQNLYPTYAYLEPIQKFKFRNNLPKELYNLDILDGSPPCSTFSLAGSRNKYWGKKKKFNEGQAEQILDELFFHYIDLIKKLQPKIAIAENVKGLIQGKAKGYLLEIYHQLQKVGYNPQIFILNSASMGLPQARERVFIIAQRRDLKLPKLKLNFNKQIITFGQLEKEEGTYLIGKPLSQSFKKWWLKTKEGESFSKAHPKGSYFNTYKVSRNSPLPTITATKAAKLTHWKYPNEISDKALILGSSFPLDYNFRDMSVKYVVGMSVPPVMMANISWEIYKQWLNYLEGNVNG